MTLELVAEGLRRRDWVAAEMGAEADPSVAEDLSLNGLVEGS